MRIENSGTYEYCRWHAKDDVVRINFEHNIRNQLPTDFFQNTMAPYRQSMLDGVLPADCCDCKIMEQYGKVSGRQRQLLKVGIQEQWFEKTLASSPMRPSFDYSAANNGVIDRAAQDWQIDLGNYCNSACVFCRPEWSSRLATEFLQLGLIDQLPAGSWCEDPILLARFIDDISQCQDLKYLHFIGGETLITPGFKKILTALIHADLAKNITVGFTTNLTVWDNDIVELLSKFESIHLGLSIETITPLNEYVRWPGKFDQTIKFLNQWIALGKQLNWLIQLRITPTCLTIMELDTVYEYAWNNKVSVESCNFLNEPGFLRLGVLTKELRQQAHTRLKKWIDTHQTIINDQIVNTRNPEAVQTQICQDAQSYLNYIETAPDETDRLLDLIAYLKKLESNRKNKILDYLPQYENLFRSAGY
jgi:sulfatase maturation enzyme AslB (radical SAM superfamily)